jgi:hypothetical protein
MPLIAAEIDAGRPVIAQGIVGPPECCVVTGYERGGEVLWGWSYFQQSPDNYFRTDDWSCFGLIRLGPRLAAPDPGAVQRGALRWAIRLVREPSFDGVLCSSELTPTHANGLSAYDEMAAALLRDRDFQVADHDWEVRVCAVGNDGLYLIGMEREAASRFLDTQAELGLPGAGHLRRAAAEYRDEVALLKEKAWPLTPHTMMPAEKQAEIKDRARREALSHVVREARAIEERAGREMEEALKALEG